jgi:Zn-dependent peptidase ImmA (M78 family)
VNRRALVIDAAQAASDARDQAGLDLISPIDVYGLAERLGVRVLFLDVSMEGFYHKGPPSKIILSAQRPLARRAYTCAHEIGHHWFGHGSTIDELREDERQSSEKPEEILAEAFAAFVTMPTIGLRHAFAKRGWAIKAPTPVQVLTVASEFGVGYGTVLTHLTYTLRDLPEARRVELAKWTPQRIRNQLVGVQSIDALTILDAKNAAATTDLEIGHGVTLPSTAAMSGDGLEHLASYEGFELYQATKRGLTTVETDAWSAELRVAKRNYAGRAIYRHLEDPDE